MPIKVLIIDDSALMRQMLTEVLSQDPDIEVVGAAPDPVVAIDKIKRFAPDVLTLDVEMPRMDGLTFLERLMRARPMPVLMISSLTEKGCATTLRALELGAVDFVTKPKVDVQSGTAQLAHDIVEKVKMAARARIRPRPAAPPPAVGAEGATKAPAPAARGALLQSTHKVAAIGASTGGTEALLHVLQGMPPDAPGIVIVQHMPEQFTRAFADRLDRSCRVRVKEAQTGDPVLPGHVLIAPGNKHMRVTRSGARYSVTIDASEPVNRHRPSVDVLFDSVAEFIGSNAVGALLTGMGRDGAKGLLTMKQAGAATIAQNEATCVVYGMPREAVALGAADQVLPLEQIAAGILRLAR